MNKITSIAKTAIEVIFLDNKQYNTYLQRKTPNSPIVKDCLCAFLVGGGICCIAH